MNRTMRGAGLVILAGILSCGGEPPDTEAATTDTGLTIPGFATPESVLHDAVADVYLVSNINGAPLDADDNGFISRVSPTGEMLELRWIDGADAEVSLNAPKGMALVGDTLYVTDITSVRMFHRQTGAPLGEVSVAGATFLNDLAAGPDGAVYFTDSGFRAGAEGFEPSGTDAVYRLMGRDVLVLARGADLHGPNGVTVVDGAVWVVTFGGTELYRVADGAKADVDTLPGGGLDGLVAVGTEVVISSWEGQALFRGSPGGVYTTAVSGVESPADLGYDAGRARLLIPLFQANEVRVVPLPATP